MKKLLTATVLMCLWTSCAFAADAGERKFIHVDMTEGQVLEKIGKPDSESVQAGGGAQTTVKQWIYLPDPADQDTLTTITFVHGGGTDVSRKIAR